VTAEAIAQRIQRYVLDGSDEDLRRLLRLAQVTEAAARGAFARVGVQDGWVAVDCGCGPIGALPVLAELVGATGHVVGVDSNQACIDTARSMIATLGLDTVELVCGDANTDAGQELSELRFDLAFTRCFLMHQPQPARTLARIASLLRPGGWVVVQEPLRTPAPRSSPPCEALTVYWELLHSVIESAGVPHDSVDGLGAAAHAAGLDVVVRNGFFIPADAPLGFSLHAGTLAAAKTHAVKSGAATSADVDELVSELRAAAHAGYAWVTTPFFADLALKKPLATGRTPGS
jgi:SAM-dependent methyltransferase